MVRDNVTFRITVDSKMAEAAFKRLKADVISLGGEIEKVGPKTQKLGNDLSNMGKNATASAVNFQTATQGLLNLSTAAVQTYTSISNLDRANNRAKQSVIAVARAEDLLANKKQRANEMVENGTASGMKYKNILREIETAEADLAVKIEKKGIEQAAVNDIYMLFATNVANVVISSTQTLVVLLGQERAARIGVQLATKLQTLATWDNVRAARFQAGETKALNALFAGTTLKLHGVTLATKMQTAATHALKIALGPIGLIFIGISAAMAAYETNLWGMKDAINGLLGIQDNFEQQLIDERKAVDELTDSFGNQQTKLFQLPDSYSGLIRELEKVRSKYVDVTNTVNDNTNAIITNNQLQPHFSSGGGTSHITNGSLNATPTAVLTNNGYQMAYASVYPGAEVAEQMKRDVQINGFAADDYRNRGKVGAYIQSGGGSFVLDNPIFGFVPTKTSIILPNGAKLGQHPIGPGANRVIEDYINQAALLGGKELAQELGISEEEGLQQFINTESFQQIREEIILQTIQMKYSGVDSQKFKTFTPESFVDFKRDEGFKKSKEDAKIEAKRNIQFGATRAGLTVKEYTKRMQMRGLYQAVSPTGIALKQKTESGSIIERRVSSFGALTDQQIKSLGGIRRIGADIVFMEKKARLAPSLLRRALEGKRDYGDDTHMNLVQDALNAQFVLGRQGVNITGFGSIGGLGFGKGLILSNDDPRLRSTAGMGPIQAEVFRETGQDIGKVAEVVGIGEAKRLAQVEKGMSYFANVAGGLAGGAEVFLAQQGKQYRQMQVANAFAGRAGFGGGFFKSSGATAAYQVANVSSPIWRRNQIAIEDRNRNRLKTGGQRVLNDDGTPMYELWDERAVTGGYNNQRSFRLAMRRQFWTASNQSIDFFVRAFGEGTTTSNDKSAAIHRRAMRIEQQKSVMSLLGRTGLNLSTVTRNLGNWGSNFNYAAYYARQTKLVHQANRATMARAAQVDLLIGGFGLDEFYGSGLGLQQLQLQVQKQDDLIKSIGLNRTEAFRIIDTQGRGRNEIDDRIRWTQRNESISTGNIVL